MLPNDNKDLKKYEKLVKLSEAFKLFTRSANYRELFEEYLFKDKILELTALLSKTDNKEHIYKELESISYLQNVIERFIVMESDYKENLEYIKGNNNES
jgi:hypothetical protein